MSPVIDKGIPVPDRWPESCNRYPVEDMEVGDSFFLPFQDANKLRVAVTTKAKALRFKMTIRKVREDGIEGYRTWRVS